MPRKLQPPVSLHLPANVLVPPLKGLVVCAWQSHLRRNTEKNPRSPCSLWRGVNLSSASLASALAALAQVLERVQPPRAARPRVVTGAARALRRECRCAFRSKCVGAGLLELSDLRASPPI
eukprot:3247988-Pleurochrysis_carterae.AAC.1